MQLLFVRLLIVVSSILCIHVNALSKAIPPKAFMVCGDSKILMVDYMNSNDTNPKIIWQWEQTHLNLLMV